MLLIMYLLLSAILLPIIDYIVDVYRRIGFT
jgi:hypothetical protein